MDQNKNKASTITHFNHLRIPLEDVQEATNNFDANNVIGQGDLGKVYKGKLLRSGKWVKIAARRLDSKHKRGIEFLTEISALSSLKHENIISFIGFCDEKGEKVIINKHEAKGSLSMHLSKPTLTWLQRLRISIGVARALSYIHKGNKRGYSVIHRNINSSTILLNRNCVAKLSGFEYSITHSVDRMEEVLFSEAIGTTGYMDPEIKKTGGVTHKSDIYSFGILLWEILCGRIAFIPNDEYDRFLASVARFHYENNTLDEIIQPGIRSQVCLLSLHYFSKAADSCLRDERLQRPDMNNIILELERAYKVQMPYESLSKLEHMKFLKSHLKIRLADIMLATKDFSEAYRIGEIGYYDLYRAELGLDEEDFASQEGKNKGVPKRCTSVVIKRIRPREDNQGEEIFSTEIEMLTFCNDYNIVTPLGFCAEGSEKILVVEDVWNVSLNYYLVNIKDMPILSWAQRIVICLDIARGLSYLHHIMAKQQIVINHDINSRAISLDKNWRAKVFDLGYSSFPPPNQDDDALRLSFNDYSKSYKEPDYDNRCKIKKESDVYSFGVLLFEILCGRVANDPIYTKESDEGLAFVTRRCFQVGTLKEMIDPLIKVETSDNGPNKDSLDIVVTFAYQCLAENQDQRPTMTSAVKVLDKAISVQMQVQCEDADEIAAEEKKFLELKLLENLERSENTSESPSWNDKKGKILEHLEHLRIPLSDILSATNNFDSKYCKVVDPLYFLYEAELEHFDKENVASLEEKSKSELPKRRNMVIIKKFHPFDELKREDAFLTDIEMLTTCKHPNIVTLLGFCEEQSKEILILEHFSNGYLEDCLHKNKHLHTITWAQRLNICLDVARGLNYLHHEMEDQKMVINCNIRSHTIALDENWQAKIVDFVYSKFLPPNQDDNALYVSEIVNKNPDFTDPEYTMTGKLKRESDVYSFGTVLLNIFCGRVDKLLGGYARNDSRERLMELIDPIIKEESAGNNFSLHRGPNKMSLEAFLNIACQCVQKTQDRRPTMKVVVKELEKAIIMQENDNDGNLRISFEDIKLATENFHDGNCVGGGGFGNVYKGKLPRGDSTIVAKRLDTSGGQGEKQFRNELQILFEYKHENIIPLVGYCDEQDAKIIVYEYAPRGSLDRYLNNAHLNWMRRLKISIDIATALDVLHRGVGKQATVIHRDIKTANILLTGDWNAKLADFGLSLRSAINEKTDYVIDRACGTLGYVDQLYLKSGFLTIESDIYAFGVVLFEILCGRSTFVIHKQEGVYLPIFVKERFEKGQHDTVVFEEIKAQIIPEALSAFQTIAYQCLNENREERPKAKEVVERLKKALELQVSRGDGTSTSPCQSQDLK